MSKHQIQIENIYSVIGKYDGIRLKKVCRILIFEAHAKYACFTCLQEQIAQVKTSIQHITLHES